MSSSHVPSIKTLLTSADEYMNANQPQDALRLYKKAWDAVESSSISAIDTVDEVSKVWILLSRANAAIRCQNGKESKVALTTVFSSYVHTGIVLGNPLFHLLMALTYRLGNENPLEQEQNLARAVICGGMKILEGEDEKLVTRMKMVLELPEVTDTWETYEGCSLDTLNGATGYLAAWIESRIGKPLPYDIVDDSEDSESDPEDHWSNSDEESENSVVVTAIENVENQNQALQTFDQQPGRKQQKLE
jgi:hypothetical protein